jgi:hypothetical protein
MCEIEATPTGPRAKARSPHSLRPRPQANGGGADAPLATRCASSARERTPSLAYACEVRLDRAHAHEELGGHLAVGPPFGHERGDLPLRGCERVAAGCAWKLLVGSGAGRALEGSDQLQRIERVAARARVDGAHERRRGRRGCAAPEKHGQIRLVERADRHALGRGQRVDHGHAAPGSSRRASRRRTRSAHRARREAEDRGARGVGPLDVVDRDMDGLRSGELANRGEEGHGERARVLRRVVGGLVEQQRGAERAALRAGAGRRGRRARHRRAGRRPSTVTARSRRRSPARRGAGGRLPAARTPTRSSCRTRPRPRARARSARGRRGSAPRRRFPARDRRSRGRAP